MPKHTRKKKLGKIELSEAQKAILVDPAHKEFLDLLTDVILPQRIDQIALTALYAAQDVLDLRRYQGMAHLGNWFRNFLLGEAEKIENELEFDDTTDDDLADDDPNA